MFIARRPSNGPQPRRGEMSITYLGAIVQEPNWAIDTGNDVVKLEVMKMTTPEPKPPGWMQIRRQLADWSKPALLALVKDLYNASTANRDFLQARFQAEEDSGPALEKYRRKVIEQFYPKRGFGDPKLAEARKAIREYRKATGNLAGTIDLLLTYVENGTAFTRDYGDMYEGYYNSLESALNELARLLRRDGAELYPRFRERLLKLMDSAGHIGWGYGDYLLDQIYSLDAELAPEENPPEA